MKLFLRLSQVVPLRECSAAVLRTWERPASLPPATSSISSVRMKTQHRLFFFTWNKLISPRRGWWDSDCAGYFFKNKPTNAFLFQRVGFCCVTWFKKTFFFCRFLIGSVQWSGPGKQERFLKKKENEAKTTCSTKLIPFSCPPGFYSFFVVRFFFFYIYIYLFYCLNLEMCSRSWSGRLEQSTVGGLHVAETGGCVCLWGIHQRLI